jgi:phosphate transport system substrate-binding protein
MKTLALACPLGLAMLVAPHAAGRAERLVIDGAGATTPYPLYARWIAAYEKQHPQVEIRYQAIGSGGGIRMLAKSTVFFAGTDGPATDEQIKAMPDGVLHLPSTIHGVVPIYNLPSVRELRLGGQTIADIVLGKVTRWRDPEIAGDNPGTTLPDLPIKPILGSDGSAANYVIKDYLAKVSPEFKERAYRGVMPEWPVSFGHYKSAEGAGGVVHQVSGAIGFVELPYALANKMSYSAVGSFGGEFVKASRESLTAAAEEAIPFLQTVAPDYRVSITNAPGRRAYPIASFSWLLLPRKPVDKKKALALAEFLRWSLDEGQGMAVELGYAPLPEELRRMERDILGEWP